MIYKVSLAKTSDSDGLNLPMEVIDHLKAKFGNFGDNLFLIERPDGYLLTPLDAQARAQVESGRQFIGDYKDTFKLLAQ